MKTKKGGYAKNKKVHKKENKKGTFTTINHSTLRDKGLTSTAKLLLFEILSDSDGFKFSEQLYMNRMGIAKGVLYNAMDSLIENGYLKKTKIQDTHYNYYTISEFGNLNTKAGTSEESTNSKIDEPEPNKEGIDLEVQKKVFDYLNPYFDFINEDVVEEYQTLAKNGLDYFKIKSALDKILTKNQVQHFNEIKSELLECSASQKVKDEAIKLLKMEIFQKLKKVETNRMRSIASQNINKRRVLDPESLQADKMDGI
ncbi:hypothetical protein [Psychroserpens luteus]|uniref:Uncharacterized protein n=1 Tax=Psychroserpens luteus TaxID=1434066 RepID=A0ABW5ZY35_9FLAO|nr:hypothetical protein [Psychroserpens luteus]